MKRKHNSTETFCTAYLATMDPRRAAELAGRGDGFALLRSEQTTKRLTQMREAAAGQIQREDVIRRLCELAFGRANDAIALALAPPEKRPDPKELELSAVAEFKVTDKGGVEIRFTDRIRALEALAELLGADNGKEGPADFFRALETAGEWNGEE